MDLTKYHFEWFVYVAPVGVLAGVAGSTASVTLQIAADAEFQVQFLTASIFQANAVVTTFAGFVEILWSAEGRFLSNVTMPINALLGNGSEKYWLEPYRRIPSNSSIQINWTNSGAAVVTNCHLAFHGNKVTPRSRPIA